MAFSSISVAVMASVISRAAAQSPTQPPSFNNTKCPGFWELQTPGMKTFDYRDLQGFYYELAFHDMTQYPLCPFKAKCITSSKRIQSYADGQKFVNDTWDLQCD